MGVEFFSKMNSGSTALAKLIKKIIPKNIESIFIFGILYYEYYNLYAEGLDQKSSFGTAFFALTGIHGLHVLVGIVVLSILFWLERSNNLSSTSQLPESIVLYWHFVDAIWILILLIVYSEAI